MRFTLSADSRTSAWLLADWGRGLLLTSEQCLLNPNRNSELDRSAIERNLRAYLGVHTILWLGEGIVGDDTDGHIDDITRFYQAGRVHHLRRAHPPRP